LSPEAIQSILGRAAYFSDHPSQFFDSLKHTIVANLFFEDSTRTRLSFEVAEKKIGAKVLNFKADSSSLNKGETLIDTLKTIEAIGPSIAVMRHGDDNLLEEIASKTKISIVNAGAGKKEHPTQALLDALTMQQEFGELKDKHILICGDIKYSRVASSNIILLQKLGAKVMIAGPELLLPEKSEAQIVDLEEGIKQADVVMMLRIQHERHAGLDVEKESYLEKYGLTVEREKMMKKNAIIMHPGPFNRGVEIANELIDHPRSRIFKQVSNGVFTRMAILEYLKRDV
jgi:aspartate carbamoyltransferase catalytic subunit